MNTGAFLSRDAEKKSARFCLIMGAVGALCGIVLSGVFPHFLVYPDSDWNGFPPWAVFLVKIEIRANNWPWVLITAAIVVAIIVRMRFKSRAWVLATALGVLFGSLAIRGLRFWLL